MKCCSSTAKHALNASVEYQANVSVASAKWGSYGISLDQGSVHLHCSPVLMDHVAAAFREAWLNAFNMS